ncbi:hypothetical protein IGI04_022798 [Brassica rapa subsp. trilocularis]|uniref:Protein kinase domain-containing protein n=1 Tax=Brassica rapa subsp. trilocularis TaxID=1813537 RepID=A0ABQ7M1Y9_BRACM|nr:serine/threonine-protein kinase STY17-like [Brassica napus]KAG5392835.1 hypothetical protein IGI04_022798 [Brassica rapa subsp. trilocularis]
MSPVTNPQDVLIHLRLLKRVEESRMLAHEIWPGEKQEAPTFKIAVASVYESDLHDELKSTISDKGMEILFGDTFRTRDGYYALDLFRVIASHDLEEFSNVLKAAITDIERANRDIDLGGLVIGENISSHVYQGTLHSKEVCVRELQTDRSLWQPSRFWKKMKLFSGLGHPNVVRCLGANTQGTDLKIITEYMHGGTLFHYLQRNHCVLTLSQRLKMAIDVCKGIEFLHANMIIHRNLNSMNLLLDENNVVKVDVAAALYLLWAGKNTTPELEAMLLRIPTPEQNNTKIRTWYRWTAPEAMNEEKYGDRADVYSFGLLLWHLITAKLPYDHLDNISPCLAAQRVIGGERPAIPENMNLKLKIIVENCWNEDPFFRPSISQVSTTLHTLLSTVNEPKHEPEPEAEFVSANPIPTESVYNISPYFAAS